MTEQSFRQSTEVVARKISGETLIVPVCRGIGDLASIYSLNEIGTLIWESLAEPCTIGRVAEKIAGEYQVERDVAVADVSAFVGELQSVGLVLAEHG